MTRLDEICESEERGPGGWTPAEFREARRAVETADTSFTGSARLLAVLAAGVHEMTCYRCQWPVTDADGVFGGAGNLCWFHRDETTCSMNRIPVEPEPLE